MKRRVYIELLGGLFLLPATPSLARACAVCLTGANDATAHAFNWSILFLMVTPYLVVGSIGGFLYYVYRRAMARRALEETAAPVAHLAFSQKESGR